MDRKQQQADERKWDHEFDEVREFIAADPMTRDLESLEIADAKEEKVTYRREAQTFAARPAGFLLSHGLYESKGNPHSATHLVSGSTKPKLPLFGGDNTMSFHDFDEHDEATDFIVDATSSLETTTTSASGSVLSLGQGQLSSSGWQTTENCNRVDADGPLMELELPQMEEVHYHRVNPAFESSCSPNLIRDTLQDVLKSQQQMEFQVISPWRLMVSAVVAAEEIGFSIQLFKLHDNRVRVDFNLQAGDERLFLALTDQIRHQCRALDDEMKQLPAMSFDLFSEWENTPTEIYPDSLGANPTELGQLLNEINSEYPPPLTRYEVAKRIKDICQHAVVREIFASSFRDEFKRGIFNMLRDDNEDIVRFGVFSILNFAQDVNSLKSLELRDWLDTLQQIELASQKNSTKQLTHDLLQTIQAIN